MKHWLLLVVVCACGSPQSASPSFVAGYDKFRNVSECRLEPMFVHHGGGYMSMQAVVSSEGARLSRPETVLLGFVSGSSDWRFLHMHDLRAIADGERIQIEGCTHDGGPKAFGSTVVVQEFVWCTLPVAVFDKLAMAKAVELQLGTLEFPLYPNHIAALAEISSRLR